MPAGQFPFEKGNRKTFIKFILNALGAVVLRPQPLTHLR